MVLELLNQSHPVHSESISEACQRVDDPGVCFLGPLAAGMRACWHQAEDTEGAQQFALGEFRIDNLQRQPPPCAHPGEALAPRDAQDGLRGEAANAPVLALGVPEDLRLLQVFESKAGETGLKTSFGLAEEGVQPLLEAQQFCRHVRQLEHSLVEEASQHQALVTRIRQHSKLDNHLLIEKVYELSA
jgi:hypothetical protein